jgi:hypothetical protein
MKANEGKGTGGSNIGAPNNFLIGHQQMREYPEDQCLLGYDGM